MLYSWFRLDTCASKTRGAQRLEFFPYFPDLSTSGYSIVQYRPDWATLSAKQFGNDKVLGFVDIPTLQTVHFK